MSNDEQKKAADEVAAACDRKGTQDLRTLLDGMIGMEGNDRLVVKLVEEQTKRCGVYPVVLSKETGDDGKRTALVFPPVTDVDLIYALIAVAREDTATELFFIDANNPVEAGETAATTKRAMHVPSLNLNLHSIGAYAVLESDESTPERKQISAAVKQASEVHATLVERLIHERKTERAEHDRHQGPLN